MTASLNAPNARIDELPKLISSALDLARNPNASFTAAVHQTVPAPGREF